MDSSLLLEVFIITTVLLNFTSGRSSASHEHLIRKMLLMDYDKTVRPPPSSPNVSAVNVEFGLKISRLVELNSKEERMILDTWVVMKWNNSFFSWKPKEFGGMNKVHFLPSEIWFPDIVLYNNGDDETPRAGGRAKFLSNVLVESNGKNTWSGPASFKATCKLALHAWPFDDQTCELMFGSYSYDSTQLTISKFETRKQKSSSFKNNPNWNVESALTTEIEETDFGDCCPYEFSQIKYTLKLERRVQYFLFYLVCPCVLLSVLTLLSFCIPSESGERIGFVTTLLLGMMVFLLVVPQSLPQSSETIPVLGIVMMGTMVIITLALCSTILVLRVFHAQGIPPKYMIRIFKNSRRLEPQPIEVLEAPDDEKRDVTPNTMQLQEKTTVVNPEKFAEEDAAVTWQMVASKMDKVFFWIFLLLSLVIYSVMFTYH